MVKLCHYRQADKACYDYRKISHQMKESHANRP